MRKQWIVLSALSVAACASQPPAEPVTPAVEVKADVKAEVKVEVKTEVKTEVKAAPVPLAADTPSTTVAGNTFVAPAGWTIVVDGPATIVTPPEGGSRVAFVDVEAADADAAVERAWAAVRSEKTWPLLVKNDLPEKDGWSKVRSYQYQTSPNEKRSVAAAARLANGVWTVALFDFADDVGEKRGSQIALLFNRLLPKGKGRESFAGKKAHVLDAARIAELGKYVEGAQKVLGIPGVAVGLVQDGKVVFAGGYGVRALGQAAKVDGDTKFLVASNTKAWTTLMLAKLVDEKKLTWDTPATSLLPSFKLGDADTTSKVQVKHLICACTGMPRQDMEWILQFQGVTPDSVMTRLGEMQPTSKFGELFQYSNPLAAAAGFIGGHVVFPKLELGKAYDEAMKTRVFEPLGMKSTTLDPAKGRTGNFAEAHAPDVDGKVTHAEDRVNGAILPVRPAGGAWSTVKDMLKYVQMELDEGVLPNRKTYLAKETLLARRAPQVAIGADASYGMGLMVNHKYDVTVVHHGGDMVGFHSDMMWLPEHGVGAVVLTNGDPGWLLRSIFRRKLLEVLFDGNPEADADVAAAGRQYFDELASMRKLLTLPADAAEATKLAAHYSSPALGDITVTRKGPSVIFDFGEWTSEMASKKNPDGTTSFVTAAPGIAGLELVVGTDPAKKTLTLRDAQHEYVFDAK
ncbi:beta-lactamase family protein [Myxococcota bacterium]|nr:beta-lactamase family protein [Myxococcota bacterium]